MSEQKPDIVERLTLAGDSVSLAARQEITTLRRELAEMRERAEKAEAVVAKLPDTEDGVKVVPNVDPIWIDPNEPGGWPHDEHSYGHFDDNDEFVPSLPIEIAKWSWHGDHLWVGIGDEGDHWFGKFYSTPEAAAAAKGGDV